MVELTLISRPRGAEVFLNGREFLGLTPKTIRRKQGLRVVAFHFRKKGYVEQKVPATMLNDQTIEVILAEAGHSASAISSPPAGSGITPRSGFGPPPPPPPPPSPEASGDDKGFKKFGDFKPVEFGK